MGTTTENTVDAQARALITEAATAIDAATELYAHNDVAPAALDETGELQSALRRLDTAHMHSVERYERHAAGMDDEDGDIEPYDALDDTWDCVTVVDDERDPQVAVSAPNAHEANRRALTWANLERELPAAIIIDSPRRRLAGTGTREIAAGRWQVTIEGW